MLIAQISDTHILSAASGDSRAPARAEDLRRCVADINSLDPLPDVVVHTGDTVQTGAPADYERLRELLAPLKMPIHLTPGNRDDRNNFKRTFNPAARDEPFLHYAVEDYPVRLIALDSIDPPKNLGVYCADRLRWLDDMLGAAPDRPTILFMHHPPLNEGEHYADGDRDPSALAAVIGRHRQVRRVLCGHCHFSSLVPWAGTQATTMPSVARDVRKRVDPRHGETPIYQLHAVDSDGRVATQTRFALN